MMNYGRPSPAAIVIFGAAGDLAWRKLTPALFDLWVDQLMPERFAIIGVDVRRFTDARFRDHLREGVAKFSRHRKTTPEQWKAFAAHIDYRPGNLEDMDFFRDLAGILAGTDKDLGSQATRVFYLAIPPSFISVAAEGLSLARLARHEKRNRVVVEKPFGHDLESARELNRLLTELFDESQVFRIDHYLGKETVQNILALRFANSTFEPVWNRRYVDHVQITVAESIGVEHRGSYYEHAGALRDMLQNHLLQVLCLVAMEPAVSYDSHEVRDKKVELLRAVRPIPRERVAEFAVRGQYGPGWIRGKHVRGYRQEEKVAERSNTETFAAVKLLVDNWRWRGVPFYLRTGKRLPSRVSEVVVQFHPVPHLSLPYEPAAIPQPNRMVIRIQPEEGIVLRIQAKQPGEPMRLAPVDMRFSYREAFQAAPPEAYETLLLDVMLGDTTQFMRADQLEYSWAIIAPILEAWQVSPARFPDYQGGTWGPEAASSLIAQDGRNWARPFLTDTEVEAED